MAPATLTALIEAIGHFSNSTSTLSRNEETLRDIALECFPEELEDHLEAWKTAQPEDFVATSQIKLIAAYNAFIDAGNRRVAGEIWDVGVLEFGRCKAGLTPVGDADTN
ncbi:hypothetical protein Slin14017_G069220 [Septoria linicola]|nr:hypothetical protein Slin14017_G069220 [Septoria linicola]